MLNQTIDTQKIDFIVKTTIEAINKNKLEMYEISKIAKKNCENLEFEFIQNKNIIESSSKEIKSITTDVEKSKEKLVLVSKNFSIYTQKDIKDAYEEADELIVLLSIKKQDIKFLLEKKDVLRGKINDEYKLLKKTETTLQNINISLKTLSGELTTISSQLDNTADNYKFGIKIIRAQEEERRRVSKDILLGPVVSMNRALEVAKVCEETIDTDIEQVTLQIQNLKGYVRDSLKSIRQIIYNLRPMSLDDLGLIPTLQRFVSSFQEETSIDVLYKSSHSIANIPSIISLTVFRVVQECLSNIKKHSEAKSARVIIEFLYDKINLIISDDGVGIKSDIIMQNSNDSSQNFGLFSIKERVELLRGTFQIVSIPNQGTRIFASLPLTANENEFVLY